MTNERRPRLDAIIRFIADGRYDEDLNTISEAINARREERKQAVLKTVKEVFGNDHKIVSETFSDNQLPKKEKINIVKHSPVAPDDFGDDLIGPDPDSIIAAEKPPESGLTGEFESRSPKFGSIDLDAVSEKTITE